MKSRLEEQMRQMTEHASVEDIVPGLDMEQLWGSIADELHPEKKKRRKLLFGGWISHAAAVLLAVVVTALLVSKYWGEDTTESTVAARVTKPRNPVDSGNVAVAPAIKATPAAVREATASGSEPQLTRNSATPVKRMPAVAVSTQPASAVTVTQPVVTPQPSPAVQQPEIGLPAPRPLIAQRSAPRKVVHYLDIEEEDAPAVAAVPAPQPALCLHMRLNKPDAPQASQPGTGTPIKNFVVALAR